MFLIVCIILLVVWLLGWIGFNMTSELIHLLIVFAAISLMIHFVLGPGSN